MSFKSSASKSKKKGDTTAILQLRNGRATPNKVPATSGVGSFSVAAERVTSEFISRSLCQAFQIKSS